MGAPGIVFADMDGTFLALDKAVPPDNLRVLDELCARHIPFVPCTGRPAKAVPEVVLNHPATTHVISSNGSVVQEVSGRRLHEVGLDADVVCDLYERVAGVACTFDIFCDGEVYSERARYEAMGDFGIDAPSLEMLRRVRRPTDLSVPELARAASTIEKVTCFWKTEADRDALVRALEATMSITYAKGHPQDFEIQAKGASKGAGLVWLCDYLGLDVARSVAFGDEGNDVSLMRAAGDGVAMANASAEVLSMSDHVAPHCDEAGVATYLRGLLSGE